MPSESTSIFCSRTISRIVITGNDSAYGLPVAGIQRPRPAGPLAPAQHVAADDEIPVGIERLTRPDHVVPPARLTFMTDAGRMRVAGKGVPNQNRIAARSVQLAVCFVSDLNGS